METIVPVEAVEKKIYMIRGQEDITNCDILGSACRNTEILIVRGQGEGLSPLKVRGD